jgi:hypothetical protein
MKIERKLIPVVTVMLLVACDSVTTPPSDKTDIDLRTQMAICTNLCGVVEMPRGPFGRCVCGGIDGGLMSSEVGAIVEGCINYCLEPSRMLTAGKPYVHNCVVSCIEEAR